MWVEDKTAPAAEPKDLWISENEAFWPFRGRAEADVLVGQYLLWIWAVYMGCYSLPHPHISSSSRWVRMDCSDHGSQSLSRQAQAKPAVCSTYRLMLKESMTCPGLGKLCIYKMLFASCIPVNCPHFDLEEADYWSSNAWKFESSCITFQALKASVLLILEHDLLESSPRTDTDRCHIRQGCRELQVNPTWPSVFLPRESAHSPQTQEDV